MKIENLQNLHLTLNANKFQLFCWTITIVEEELFTGLNYSLCENPDSMITVNHYNFRIAIRIDGMICKANFIALACSIYHEIVIEIEEETASVFIIDFSTAIRFILTDDFSTIFLCKKYLNFKNFLKFT